MSTAKAASTGWKFVGHCVGHQRFRIQGINVWDHKWIHVKHDPPPPPTGDERTDWFAQHETVSLKDPVYDEDVVFDVYEIAADSRRIVFAAGEFSNMIWGFYVPNSAPERLKFKSWLTVLFGRYYKKRLDG